MKETLAALNELLPRLPDALTGLLSAQGALEEAAEQFTDTIENCRAEASELFPRVEVSLAGLAREAADGAAQVEQDRDVNAILNDPDLSFEDKIALFLVAFLEKQQEIVQDKMQAMGRMQEHVTVLDTLRDGLRTGLLQGQQRVGSSVEAAIAASHVLQSTVDATRTTVSEDVEKLGMEIDAQHTADAREVEVLRRDVETYEAAFVERIERAREVIRQEADGMVDDTRDRLDDLGHTISRALDLLRDELREMDELLKELADEGAEGRGMLAPFFDDLEHRLEPIKHAIEHVREAAALVGIPF